MVRDFRWYTFVDGMRAVTDMTYSVYNGPGTVWRLTGNLAGAGTSSLTRTAETFVWSVNVGTAAADPLVRGEDPESTLLHGGGVALNPTAAKLHTTFDDVLLESQGRRVIGPGEQVWLRVRALSGGTTWDWFASLRVLILLPEA